MKKNFRILMSLFCALLLFCAGWSLAEEAETVNPAEVQAADPAPAPEVSSEPGSEDPSPSEEIDPNATPSPEDLGTLTFQVLNEEGEEVKTFTYSEFEEGKYLLDLLPGTYTIKEVEPENLLTEKNYTYDAENSIQELTVEVQAKETVTPPPLVNKYERLTEVTPEPTPEPEPTPTPIPEEENKQIIPVDKVWDDQNNRDGNRPARVIVNLLADGKKTAQAILNEANGWHYDFVDLPIYAGTREIEYSVTEDPVPMYVASIEGMTITNKYSPEVTSATVGKVWVDSDNAAGIRPASIVCTLSNGMHVTLSDANGWTATIEDLPTIVNGQRMNYTWTEQEVIGYVSSAETIGNTTIFTNTRIERGQIPPPDGKNPPKKGRGKEYVVIDDYGTPLGVEVVINHVGDCFD